MKLFAMFIVSFAAASAMACPNLDGTFTCEKDQNDPQDSGVITIQTAQHEGSTIYVVTDHEDVENPSYLPADGKLYQEGQNTYTGSCSGNKLVTVVTGVDETVGPVTINNDYSLDASGNLVNEGKVSFKYQGQDQVHAFNGVCTKQ